MTNVTQSQLKSVDPDSITIGALDTAEIEAAFDSTDPLLRQRACQVCRGLATQDVESIRPLVSDIGEQLQDDSIAVVQAALSVLRTLASTEPTMLDSCLLNLVSVVETELSGIRLGAAQCLGALTAEHPRTCVPYVESLVDSVVNAEGPDSVEDDVETVPDPTTRQTIQEHLRREQQDWDTAQELLVNVVVACAQAAPTEFHDETAMFREMVSTDDEVVVGGGLSALSAIAKDDPSVVTVDDALVECLGHDARSVRARAIETLGFVGDESVVPALKRLSEGESDEAVAELAAATADFLEA